MRIEEYLIKIFLNAYFSLWGYYASSSLVVAQFFLFLSIIHRSLGSAGKTAIIAIYCVWWLRRYSSGNLFLYILHHSSTNVLSTYISLEFLSSQMAQKRYQAIKLLHKTLVPTLNNHWFWASSSLKKNYQKNLHNLSQDCKWSSSLSHRHISTKGSPQELLGDEACFVAVNDPL